MAREYGWSDAYVEGQLTDELFVLYLDAAQDRLDGDDTFVRQVEAARSGLILAHNASAYRSWRRSVDAQAPAAFRGAARSAGPEPLTGASLEAHVAGLRLSRPDLVARA